MDLWGQALWDYHQGQRDQPLYLETSFGPQEKVPMEDFFRYELFFPDLENLALWHCRGEVLDIGAGCGAHSLALQDMGVTSTALEVSPGACKVMEDRGVRQVVKEDIYQYSGSKFHTLLLMMNGVGLAGTLPNLETFLAKLSTLLHPGGQILLDSCDVSYLYKKQVKPQDHYYGELCYSYHYLGKQSDPFYWLFVDQRTLRKASNRLGLQTQIIYEEDSQFLARLVSD